MASPASPAQTRAMIVERLVGDTGEPDHVTDAARALAVRVLPTILAAFTETLGLAVGLELKSVEVARLINAKPVGEGHAMTIAPSPASSDALILTIEPEAVAVIISSLFGGDPEMAISPIKRALSPTEIEVVTMVFQEIAQAVNGTGELSFELTLPAPIAVTGADLTKLEMRDGPGVRSVFVVSTPAGSGRIEMLMPQRVLLKQRAANGKPAGAVAPANWRARFSEEVMRSNVDLQATMPLGSMTLGQLAGLKVGQVIELQEGAQSQARLSARQKTLFVCEFGKLGQNYTVRVRHPFDAGQDFMDGLLPG